MPCQGTYIQVSLVDLVDDLQVSGEQLLHQVHRPALQGFGEHRVVGVGESPLGDVPGLPWGEPALSGEGGGSPGWVPAPTRGPPAAASSMAKPAPSSPYWLNPTSSHPSHQQNWFPSSSAVGGWVGGWAQAEGTQGPGWVSLPYSTAASRCPRKSSSAQGWPWQGACHSAGWQPVGRAGGTRGGHAGTPLRKPARHPSGGGGCPQNPSSPGCASGRR